MGKKKQKTKTFSMKISPHEPSKTTQNFIDHFVPFHFYNEKKERKNNFPQYFKVIHRDPLWESWWKTMSLYLL